jgi:uncharacterized membrane protein YphA (DoxX/SURF4 family)
VHPIPKNKAEMAALALRVALGAWFTYSGGLKIFVTGLDRFTRDVGNYKLVSAPLDAVAAYTVPWVEVIGGLCLMLGVLRKGTLVTMTGLVLTFATAVGWAWSKNLDISCGCHGGDTKLNYWTKAAELTGYLLVFAYLWWVESRTEKRTTP